MKHLKKYKVFESDRLVDFGMDQSMLDYINDVTVDLKDIGIDLIINPIKKDDKVISLLIEMYRRVKDERGRPATGLFNWSDISDRVIQLIHYMNDEYGFNCNIQISNYESTNWFNRLNDYIHPDRPLDKKWYKMTNIDLIFDNY